MKNSKNFVKNKTKTSTTTAIAITLMMLSSIFTFMAISNVNAADVTVYPFLTVSPNPIGVGQQTIIVAWLDRLPPMFSNNTQTSWEQYTITVTHPDGETETLGPVNSDSLGSTYFAYTPTKIGTYIFTFSFPGQNAIDGNYYLPTTSHDVSLDVQQDAVEEWSANPLPTGYWERPIYGENREGTQSEEIGLALLYFMEPELALLALSTRILQLLNLPTYFGPKK